MHICTQNTIAMKYFLFSVFFIVAGFVAVQAQYTSDVHKIFGSPYSSSVNCICTDAAGNTYLAGEFNKSLLMGPYKYKDRWGGFIAKLDVTNEVIWMKRADMQIRNLELMDSLLIVFAQNTRTLSFAGTPISYTGENYMALLASVSAATGTVKWTREITGSLDVFAADMAVSGKDICVAGAFRETVSVDGKILKKTHEKNNYIARFTADGKCKWLKYVSGGDSFVTGITIAAIAVNQYGDLAITGELNGSADFAGKCYDVAELKNAKTIVTGDAFVYIAYFDAEGNVLRVHRAISEAQVTDIAFNKDQVYLCGFYTGAYLPQQPGAFSVFGDTSRINAVLNDKGGLLESWYVLSFRGNEPLWCYTTTGKNSSRPLSIVADNEGNCYTGGFFYDNIVLKDGTQFNAFSLAPFTPAMLVMKLSSKGEMLWVKTADKATGNNKIYDVSLNHKLVTCGEISGNAMFGNFFIESRGKHQNGFTFKFDL